MLLLKHAPRCAGRYKTRCHRVARYDVISCAPAASCCCCCCCGRRRLFVDDVVCGARSAADSRGWSSGESTSTAVELQLTGDDAGLGCAALVVRRPCVVSLTDVEQTSHSSFWCFCCCWPLGDSATTKIIKKQQPASWVVDRGSYISRQVGARRVHVSIRNNDHVCSVDLKCFIYR